MTRAITEESYRHFWHGNQGEAVLRRRLLEFPEASQAVIEAAHALRRPVTDVTADEVERWATTRAFR
jgi:hypothetical protein